MNRRRFLRASALALGGSVVGSSLVAVRPGGRPVRVAAAAMAVPPALLEQFGAGGRLVMPVGPDREQQLVRVTRRGDSFERVVLGPATFVPMLQGLS